MNWRHVDNMIVSKCIDYIQYEINAGRLNASYFVPITGLEGQKGDGRSDAALFNAWRIHLLDRMTEEANNNNWDEDTSEPITELEDDMHYYQGLGKSKK
jgi:hypothetical protein